MRMPFGPTPADYCWPIDASKFCVIDALACFLVANRTLDPVGFADLALDGPGRTVEVGADAAGDNAAHHAAYRLPFRLRHAPHVLPRVPAGYGDFSRALPPLKQCL